MSEQEKIRAYHEAAHAVAAITLGYEVCTVVLASWSYAKIHESNDLESEEEILKNCIVTLAGVRCGCRLGQKQDELELEKVGEVLRPIADLPIPLDKKKGLITTLEKKADRLLDEHWHAIEAVANALLEKYTLSGEQVETLIRSTKEGQGPIPG